MRLAASIEKLRAFIPLSADDIDRLPEDRQESLDAFLKRFEQLVDIIDNRLFRGLALLEQEDISDKSKRDLTLLMEKWGVLTNADAWSGCSILRNRLAHDYPAAPKQQAERVNAAHAAATLLLQTLDGIAERVRSRGLLTLD